MRLFVGVAVDDVVRREAERVMTVMRGRLRGLDARWVSPENLHLTVRFIGHVADDRAAAVRAALEQPLAVEPFDVEYGGCGRFPPRGAPRVIWIGLQHGLPPLSALNAEFDRRVAPFGYPPESRPFTAHLTLARLKDAHAAAGRNIDAALSGIDVKPIVQRVDHVAIFESRLSPNGPRYTVLRRIPLSAGDC